MSTIAIAKPNSEAKYNLIIIEGDSDKETITGILCLRRKNQRII